VTHHFLHVGDVHLQSGHPRNADRLASLAQIVAYARERDRLAAFLIPGDLFHQKSTVQDRNDLEQVLSQMAALAPVVLTPGNHDEPDGLQIFGRLRTRYPVHVVSRPQVLRLDAATGVPVAAFVLPYPHRAGLVAAGSAHASLIDEARGLLDPIFTAAAAELAEARTQGAITLMVGHVNVGGARLSSGQPNIGAEIELDPALLARLGPIYKGLNHIHVHQEIAGAVYAGSICRLDFGELEAKGFVHATFLDDEQTQSWTWQFVPLDVPAMVHIDGALTREGFTPDDPALVACAPIAGADVRVRYRFTKAEADVLDIETVRAQFGDARALQLEGVPEREHEIRAPEIAAAATLDEKVIRYCERQGLPVTTGLRRKLAALQTLSPADIQAALETVCRPDARQEVA
jgi:DNA repair protein SbcD/Mre11